MNSLFHPDRTSAKADSRRPPVGSARHAHSSGKLLILLAISLPMLVSIVGLVLDGGLLMLESRKAQHAGDAAATAAAASMAWGTGDGEQTAIDYVQSLNGLPSADIGFASPPLAGPYAGRPGYVEVTVHQPYGAYFMGACGFADELSVTTRSVAGSEPATEAAAIVLLDPNPPEVTVQALPISLPSLTPLLGGLEVLGLGRLRVNGAVLVNNEWGGVDENGDAVGEQGSFNHACSCTPLLPLTHVLATDIRVVGGVDDPDNYGSIVSGESSPLRANRRPVPDPYADLPAPTLSVDSVNISATEYGGVAVQSLPLLPPPVLQPGVYEWIQVIGVGGQVIFEPGVYIIRGVNPVTQLALNITIGNIQAEGVMFYITNSPAYSPASGTPDAFDGETAPAGPTAMTLVPSVLINVGLLNSHFSGLDDPGSPFDGLLIYQRRQDRRPIVIVQQGLLGTPDVSGNVYAKWGHVLLTANGTLRSGFVCGSLRVLSVLDLDIDPIDRLPPAYDVFLVE